MPRYRYVAVEPSAGTIEGVLEAASKAAVVDRLHAAGNVPIRIDEQSSLFGNFDPGNVLNAPAISPRSLVLVTGQLATLLHAGLAIDEALAILIDLLDKPREQACLKAVLESVSSGATLSTALAAHKKVFPNFYVSMIRAAEAGASLDTVLTSLAEFLERSQAAREHVKSALLYPLIVLVTSGLSIGVLFVFVVPRFRPLFEQAGNALPVAASILLRISDVMSDDWWMLAIALVAMIGFAIWLRRNPGYRRWASRAVLKWPIIGEIVSKNEVVRFSRTLGTLLKNGVSLLPALSITAETLGNVTFREAMPGIIAKVTTGKGLTVPLREAKIFPALAVHLVRVGDESGRQDDMLLKIAEILEADSRRSVDRLLALLTPALTVVLGLIVAAVIGSILTAVLSVYDLAM